MRKTPKYALYGLGGLVTIGTINGIIQLKRKLEIVKRVQRKLGKGNALTKRFLTVQLRKTDDPAIINFIKQNLQRL